MKPYSYRNAILIAFWILVSVCVGQTYQVNDLEDNIDLHKHTTYLADQSGKLTIQDVIRSSSFSRNSIEDLKLNGQNIIWGQVEVSNNTQEELHKLIAYCEHLDAVATYLVIGDSISAANVSGLFSYRFERQKQDNRTLASLRLKPGESATIYFRMYASGDFTQYHPNEIALVDREYFFKSSSSEYLFLGGLFGILVIMFVLSFVLWTVLWERSFLLFCFALLALSFNHAMNYQLAQTYLLPDVSFMGTKLTNVSSFFIALSFTGLIIELLQLKNTAKLTYNILWAFMGSIGLILLTSVFMPHNLMFNNIINISLIIWIVGTTGVIGKYAIKQKQARIVLVSVLILAIGGIVWLLSALHAIPNTWVGIHAYPIGSIIFCTMILFSMWNRVRTIQIDRAQTQERLLKAEREKSKVISEQNILLEYQVKERTSELEKEKEASEKLLLNILPEQTAQELKEKGYTNAQQFVDVSILFADVVGFTKISERLSPTALVNTLDYYFKGFDEIVEQHRLEKIKTIGDAYVAVCSMPTNSTSSTNDLIDASIDMVKFCEQAKAEEAVPEPLNIRIGIHTGSVIAGIVGLKKFQYDIWGDSVNVAARMQEASEQNHINISKQTYDLIKESYECESRGAQKVKNKSDLEMYFVKGRKS